VERQRNIGDAQIIFNCAHARRLVGNNGTIASARAEATGRVAATPRESDTWCCAELWNREGDTMLAVTSPIYFE